MVQGLLSVLRKGSTVKKTIFFGIVAVLLGIFLYSGYRILDKMREYKQIEDAHDSIAQLVVQTVPTTQGGERETNPTTVPKQPLTEQDEQGQDNVVTEARSPYDDVIAPIIVDFDTLCRINPDVVGWLYCEGTVINYPVLKGKDNDTYLYHQYDGTYSPGGSIFMDYRCQGDFSGDYTVIYGHNMLADSMFNCLDYFRDKEYLEDHSRFFYLTPSGKNYCLEVICVNLTAYKDELRLFELRDDQRDLELIRAHAESDTGIEATNEDQLVLLTTCTYDFKNAKCTLLCKAVELNS